MKALSEGWPGLLLATYCFVLLITFFKSPNLFAEELKMFLWYLAVGLLAAVLAHDAFVFKVWPIADGVDINLFGLLRNYWHDVVIPFTSVFICLSLPRHLIVTLLYWRKRKQSKGLSGE